MPSTRNFRELAGPIDRDPRRRANVDRTRRAMEAALGIAAVRRGRDTTQVDLAESLKTTQSRVSRIERSTDLHLSTLRDYVRALGGELEMTAVFPDGQRILIDNAA